MNRNVATPSTRKRILIVTYHFPPSAASGAYRILGFARHLPSFGWDVAVVAPPTLPWEPVDRRLAEQVPEATTVIHEPYRERLLTKPIRKWAPYAFWVMSGARGIRRAFSTVRPDVVLTSAPPHVVHFAALARQRRTMWVADFRDPWATGDEQLVHAGAVPRLMERSVIRVADAVIWNTPRVLDHMKKAFPEYASKMECVPNGFDPEVFPSPSSRASGAVCRLLHTGMIYFGRDPGPLLDAIGLLLAEGVAVHSCFLGFTPGFTMDVESEAQRRGIASAVSVEGHTPHAIALQRMVDADILLLLDTPGRKLGVPAKLFEYIGTGRPILALCESDSDTARVLAESGSIHGVAPPHDAGQIARVLRSLAAAAARHGGAVREESPFLRVNAARKLAGLLDRLHAARSSAKE